nr:TRASH domain-containing protein [uncultured Caproiciproducens sp.]
MEKCVYCGKNLPEKPLKAKVHTRSFDVCCEDCKIAAEKYVGRDKRFKTALYLVIFLGGIGFIVSAMFCSGRYAMLAAYLGQTVAGLALFFLPYPVTSFETFHNMSIKGVTMLCRLIGAGLAVWGIVLLILL